jgi:hypothetical protein
MSDSANKSYIYRMGTSPNTRAVVSQKNKIYGYLTGQTAFKQIGVLSEFGHDESRTIDPVRGIGYGDQVAELVPGVTEPMTLTINKTLLYTLNLFQALGYKGGVDGIVRSLKHHRWPFDVKQEMVFSEIASDDVGSLPTATDAQERAPEGGSYFQSIKALFTYFEGCWLNSYSASYTSDAAIVAENSSVTVTDVLEGKSPANSEFIDTGLSPYDASSATSMRFKAPTIRATT